ncbi:DUF3159 domain-containing protein [Actinomyces viscosus]|uniref:Protein of uncharacterized function (DUF3159) n=1 Tax=Actinomyces viscosus TaxID=1656 RepID=A0A3S4V128_ACTVI|nr:DUF3159 domain-containing protein [Actinomyces viscosus]TFH52971.1 DUF3159 domain-containing protein [Actinomyces viscosus]VEI14711.1 Protein of uncharacterised function (DUF3159) [Actinomyces viscosus]
MSSRSTDRRTGLGAIDSERFDAMAAVGGWRGILESVVPTLVFVLVMAVRPTALVVALVSSLVVSAVGLVARLVQRQSPAQVVGGIALVLVSALWAWYSGEASNFYATGLMINAAWLVACLVSLLVGWPIVGALITLWHRVTDESDGSDVADGSKKPGGADSDPSTSASAWRTDPALRNVRLRYHAGTWVLTLMFALRLVVEVPLYLAGEQAVSYLGAARLILGVPLYAVTLWFIWLLVAPSRIAPARTTADQ